jgi:hypothetical protein
LIEGVQRTFLKKLIAFRNSLLLSLPYRMLDENGGARSGSVYVFDRDPATGVWSQTQKILASDGNVGYQFGVAVGIWKDTIVVGAYWHNLDIDRKKAGQAYVYALQGNVWTEQAKLAPKDVKGGDNFGVSVAIHEDTIVCGSEGDSVKGASAGVAYVFTRSKGLWASEAKLLASDGATKDEFGFSLDVFGDTIVVGAYRHAHVSGADTKDGAAYIFTRVAAKWTEVAKLIPKDARAGIEFGRDVSLADGVAAIGAHYDGSVYVFGRSSDGAWSSSDQVKVRTTHFTEGQSGDFFGFAVDVEGDDLLVGAFQHNRGEYLLQSGAAYLYSLKGVNTLPPVVAETVAPIPSTTTSSPTKAPSNPYRAPNVPVTAPSAAPAATTSAPVSVVSGPTKSPTLRTGAPVKAPVTKTRAPVSIAVSDFTKSPTWTGTPVMSPSKRRTRAPVSAASDPAKSPTLKTRAPVTEPSLSPAVTTRPPVSRASDPTKFPSAGAPVTSPTDSAPTKPGTPGAKVPKTPPVAKSPEITPSVPAPSQTWANGAPSRSPLRSDSPACYESFWPVASPSPTIDVNVAANPETVPINPPAPPPAVARAPAPSRATRTNAPATVSATAISENPSPMRTRGPTRDTDVRHMYQFWQPRGMSTDGFGTAVAKSGDFALIGAPGNDERGEDSGAVYVYRHDPIANNWFYEATLQSPNSLGNNRFGSAVALEGDTAVVGSRSGLAYVFIRDSSGQWSESSTITGSSNAKYQNVSVDIFKDTIVVGFSTAETGTALTLTKLEGKWQQQLGVLSPGDSVGSFGISVSVVEGTIVCGGREAVYAFQKIDGLWQQTAKITPSDGVEGDEFGASLDLLFSTDIQRNVLLVGAANNGGSQGAAYVFLHDMTSGAWEQEVKLVSSAAGPGDGFGLAVALEQRTAVVGAPFDDSLYIYEFNDNAPRKVTYPGWKSGSRFGSSLDCDGGDLIVGAYLHKRGESDIESGSTYLYQVPELTRSAESFFGSKSKPTDPSSVQKVSQEEKKSSTSDSSVRLPHSWTTWWIMSLAYFSFFKL